AGVRCLLEPAPADCGHDSPPTVTLKTFPSASETGAQTCLSLACAVFSLSPSDSSRYSEAAADRESVTVFVAFSLSPSDGERVGVRGRFCAWTPDTLQVCCPFSSTNLPHPG